MSPRAKEKHFLVARVINPETVPHLIEQVELEAVMTHRRFVIEWAKLNDATQWIQGWI